MSEQGVGASDQGVPGGQGWPWWSFGPGLASRQASKQASKQANLGQRPTDGRSDFPVEKIGPPQPKRKAKTKKKHALHPRRSR